MQTKLLSEIASEIAGKQASSILELLMGRKDVNEFLIAKKVGLTINQVRNILYKLANFNLVTFIRKKDKKKGWYTYFWTLDIERAFELLERKLKKEIETLKNQLRSRRTKRFYVCRTCKTEISEETALLHSFTCPECGEVYELADYKKVERELERAIARLERQRKGVLEELEKIREAKEKKRLREERERERKEARQRKLRRIKKAKKEPRKKLKKEKKVKEKAKKKSIKKIRKIVKKVVKKTTRRKK